LKFGGRLYTITDVEELNNWHVETLNSHPCFRRLAEEEIVTNIINIFAFLQIFNDNDIKFILGR